MDTDHVSGLQWGGDTARKIEKRLNDYQVGVRYPTSIITYEEQVRGWMRQLASADKVDDQIRLYTKLREQIEFYSTLKILDFTAKAATEFQRLRALGIRIGTMDLKIASIALAYDVTLLTRNFVDFKKIPGLRIEDATL